MNIRSLGIAIVFSLSLALPGAFAQVPASAKNASYLITVAGMKTFGPYKELKDLFNSGQGGFVSGREKIYSQGSATFEVVFSGSLMDLVKILSKATVTGGTVRVTQAQGNQIQLEVK